MVETSGSSTVSTKLGRIAKLAREAPDMVISTLAHNIDIEWLKEAYRRTRKDGARGVDGQSAQEYAADLEGNLRALLERAFNRSANPSDQAQVVSLDQDAIIQPQAVISPPTHAHRVFLQAAKTGRGFAGVKKFRPRARQLVLQTAGIGGNTAEVLKKVQRHALAGQQRTRRSSDRSKRRAGRDLGSVIHSALPLQGGVEDFKDLAGDGQSRHDQPLLAVECALRPNRVGKRNPRRQVALSQVFGQRVKNQVAEFLGRKI